jgi:cystathionine beta-lyase family protein involved in aluminum resistance
MERFLKEKINTCVNFFRNTINVDESYQLVETKRKIYYFSKFSLEIEEFKQIHKMVKTLKENIFKNMLDTMKYCVKGKIS